MKSEDLLPNPIDDFYQDEEVGTDWEMRCPLVLVLDKSSSMSGDPVNELNRGLKIFQTQIQNDEVAAKRLETAIVTFGSEIDVPRDFSLFEGTAIDTIEADGCTMMVEGIREAIARIEARKNWYKQKGLLYYRPYIVLMTDGYPTSAPRDIEELKNEIREGVDQKKFSFWAFGVEGADMKFLQSIAHKSFPPQKLKGYNFVEFFKWLSSSFSTITASQPDEKIDISPKQGENPFQITI